MNSEVIALSQDDLGVQGHRLSNQSGLEVWAGPLANGDIGVVLFNRDTVNANISVTWETLGMKPGTTAAVRDLVKHVDLGQFEDSYSAMVPSHGVATLRVTMVKPMRVASMQQACRLHPKMEEVLLGRRRTAGTAQ